MVIGPDTAMGLQFATKVSIALFIRGHVGNRHQTLTRANYLELRGRDSIVVTLRKP